MKKLLASLLGVACALVIVCPAVSFSVGRTNRALQPQSRIVETSKQHYDQYTRLFQLGAQENEDESDDSVAKQADLGDEMSGLANYLGPYALAFLASIAVTVGFVKFVLLDY